MISFPLPIWPEGSLADSVTVTVWLGAMVVSFFNLRFGWTYSGLVVPGYMVPLLAAKPIAALVVLLESCLTYFIVWLFSSWLSRFGLWCNVFGRDRFFALVMVSIAVRVVCDGYLLPELAAAAMEHWQIEFDASSNLHSFGLIIVSLIANQFWKPGFASGMRALLTSLAVTYLLVSYPLTWLTNFNMGALEYAYEEISVSILSSPKAYVILVVTAFMASRMNLLYSWDYSGILIPSLLALEWYEPLKVLTSIAEAWVVYSLACLVLRTPLLREATIEGARKLMLFFNIAVAYKVVLGHLLAFAVPSARATDWFGFGYLLSTLIAIKMHDKRIALRITRTTLQTSLVGAMTASAVGFCLTLLPQRWRWSETAAAQAEAAASVQEGAQADSTDVVLDLVDVLQRERSAVLADSALGGGSGPTPEEVEAFKSSLRDVRTYSRSPDERVLETINRKLASARYVAEVIEGEILFLHEREPRRGLGAFAVRCAQAEALLVEVPAPLVEWGCLESGAFIFRQSRARALAVSTWSRNKERAGFRSVLNPREGLLTAFHRAFDSAGVLEVRGYSTHALYRMYGKRVEVSDLDEVDVPSSLWVSGSLPGELSLGFLSRVLPRLELSWNRAPLANVRRDQDRGPYVELFLNREDRRRLVARHLLGVGEGAQLAAVRVVTCDPQEFVLGLASSIARRGSGLYRAPSREQLLFFDEEVLKPLVRRTLAGVGGHTEDRVEAIAAAASTLGYSLIHLEERSSSGSFLVLEPDWGAVKPPRWGTFLFRIGGGRPFVVEVPRPLLERHTLEYGASLLAKLDASFLLVAGAHPAAGSSGEADVLARQNRTSLFNLAHQVILREAHGAELLVAQVRAMSQAPGQVLPNADVLLAFGDGTTADDPLSGLASEIRSVLESDRLRVDIADGAAEESGYEVDGSVQYEYSMLASRDLFASLWISPLARLSYRPVPERGLQSSQLDALGIPTVEEPLDVWLASVTFDFTVLGQACELMALLEQYQATEDINALHVLGKLWPALDPVRVVDTRTRRPFLLLDSPLGVVPLVTSLSFQPGGSSRVYARPPVPADVVRRFAGSTASFLVVEGEP